MLYVFYANISVEYLVWTCFSLDLHRLLSVPWISEPYGEVIWNQLSWFQGVRYSDEFGNCLSLDAFNGNDSQVQLDD